VNHISLPPGLQQQAERLAKAPLEELKAIEKAYSQLYIDSTIVNELISSSKAIQAQTEELKSILLRAAFGRSDAHPEDIMWKVYGPLRVYLVEDILKDNTIAARARAWDRISTLTRLYR
jgi:hypothetical protein